MRRKNDKKLLVLLGINTLVILVNLYWLVNIGILAERARNVINAISDEMERPSYRWRERHAQ